MGYIISNDSFDLCHEVMIKLDHIKVSIHQAFKMNLLLDNLYNELKMIVDDI